MYHTVPCLAPPAVLCCCCVQALQRKAACCGRVRQFARLAALLTQLLLHAQINFLLMLGCIAMVAGFQDTTALGHAYGVAVMSVMFLTTILAGNIAALLLPVYNHHRHRQVLVYDTSALYQPLLTLVCDTVVVCGRYRHAGVLWDKPAAGRCLCRLFW